MKSARILFRVVSVLVLLASAISASGASASTKIPVAVTICPREVRLVSADPLVIAYASVMIPDNGPNGKQGFEVTVAGSTTIRIQPNDANGDASLWGRYQFDGQVWDAGESVWSGQLQLLEVANGGPTDVSGTWRTLDSTVHFLGTFVTPGAAEKCAEMGYLPGGHFMTGELHITPAR